MPGRRQKLPGSQLGSHDSPDVLRVGCLLHRGIAIDFTTAANFRFPPEPPKMKPLRACDFGSGLSSPSEAPRITLPDVLDQVRAERD